MEGAMNVAEGTVARPEDQLVLDIVFPDGKTREYWRPTWAPSPDKYQEWLDRMVAINATCASAQRS
jgi:hypothetical protein